jgi:hypothetical protein
LASPELKIGFGFRKAFNSIGLNSSLLLGLRFPHNQKNELLFKGSYSAEDYSYNVLYLSKIYSVRQLFIEIPLTVDFKIYRDKLKVHTGLLCRMYISNGSDNALCRNTPTNFGLLSSIRYSPSQRVNLSLDYFYGLSKLNSAFYVSNDRQYFAKSNFLQFSLFIKSLSK